MANSVHDRDTHLDGPSQSQVGHGAVQLLFGNLGQLLDLFDLGLSLGRLELFNSVLEELGVGSVSRVLGNAVVVLSSKLERDSHLATEIHC
jgi:hypothetical protein